MVTLTNEHSVLYLVGSNEKMNKLSFDNNIGSLK